MGRINVISSIFEDSNVQHSMRHGHVDDRTLERAVVCCGDAETA